MVASLVDNANQQSLSSRMRRERFRWFTEFVSSQPKLASKERLQIIDIGGTPGYWTNHNDALIAAGLNCDIVVINLPPVKQVPAPDNVRLLAGNATSLDEFGDQQFDIAYSNSVIEHVGTLYDQMAMAREVRRVSTCHFIQTPNKHFPIEPHFLVPFWQYLPVAPRAALLSRKKMGWIKQAPDYLTAKAEIEQVRLLTKSEMARLFPDSEIRKEKFFGLTKSIIAMGMNTC